MELSKILEAAKDKELGSDVIAAIKALDQSSEVTRLEGELKDEKGKTGGILEDKKKFKERMEKAESDLKELRDKDLSADELTQKKLTEMQEKLDEEKRLREEDATKVAKSNRENQSLKISSAIKWGKDVPADTRALLVKNALAGVEDLTDETKVSEVVKALTESHKTFIAADAATGTGDTGGGGGGGGDNDDKVHTLASATEDAWKKD